MLTLTTKHRLGSARLTGRGNWFARTLLHDAETSNGESSSRNRSWSRNIMT
jgi:hypothetical protein